MPGFASRADNVQLPPHVQELVQVLSRMGGVVGVALGGSRATGQHRESSDWDLAVYYTGELDWQPLTAFGTVYPPGSWGRLMNGGAWLQVAACEVDVLFRDLGVALHWSERAENGEWELDALLGYTAGLPTYSLAAELHTGIALAGALPRVGEMPSALRTTAPARWRFCRDFSLEYARMHAARGNVVGMMGNLARAVTEEAHARVCERGIWTLNEKSLITAARLGHVHAHLGDGPWSIGPTGVVDAVQASLSEHEQSDPVS